jgi:hypothetical protein
MYTLPSPGVQPVAVSNAEFTQTDDGIFDALIASAH